MLVSVCTRIDNHANYHLFFAIGTSLNQSKPIERLDNRLLTTIAITNTIIWNYNRDWSCEQAIIVPHDLRVDYITEQLYFYSMNSTVQWENPCQSSKVCKNAAYCLNHWGSYISSYFFGTQMMIVRSFFKSHAPTS